MKSLLVSCAGVNHNTSPVEERERLAFTADELPPALLSAGGEVDGAVILSTCNRTELYATVPPGQAQGLAKLLNRLKGTGIDASHFYLLEHEDAVGHLFSVAAGIDSMVLGESQILGQVRDAMSAATQAGTLNGVLSRVFHSAIAAGKRARSETEIGRHAISISSAAVALARRHAGDLRDKTILVLSAGSTGKLAARSLAESSGARILIANRTAEKAQLLAEEIGGAARGVPLERLNEGLAEADVVITGTGAGGFVLGPEQLAVPVSRRNGRGLLLIDVAVPRDIDPAVRRIPNVSLFDIDDVESEAESGRTVRQAEVQRVQAIVEEEVAGFLAWWESLDVVPVISALRERAEEIRRAELARALRRLPDLDDESRRRIEAMTSAIVKKMLDRPIARLKDGADKALYMEALEDLFDLHPSPAPSHGKGA
ncbi:MAG: glutamyl-tRNA reductase [Chloroflexi bacterium]|nr:MAG: glutamyl-tRNA reductase [Chloroflexota bacterium]